MKFRYYFALILVTIFVFNVNAQTFEDVKAPTMSAATMIGAQVNEISSPSSLKALEASLLNNFMDSSNNFIIPDGYALEFNPFMLLRGDKFHYLEYLDTSYKNLYRNLTLSLASTNSFIVNDTVKTNGLGFGFRWVFHNGKVDDVTKQKYEESIKLSDSLQSLHTKVMLITNRFVDNPDAEKKKKLVEFDKYRAAISDSFIADGTVSSSEAQYLLLLDELPITLTYGELEDTLNNQIEVKLSRPSLMKIREQMEATKMNRYGFRLELNGAMGLSFPTRDFVQSYVPKYGGWLNISYRIPKKTGKKKWVPEDGEMKEVNLKEATPFEFVGLVRLTGVNRDFVNSFNPVDSLNYDPGVYLDFGLRANVDYKRLNVGFEGIYRQNKTKEYIIVDGFEYERTVNNDTYKFLLNINYNITDNTVLSYNIGKNYDFGARGKGNLISGFTLNFGFGDVTDKELLKKK